MGQPEIVFRHGSCSASVFGQDYTRGDEQFRVRNVNFQKAYLDKEGNWQHSSSLSINDIPKAVLVLNKAYEYLTSNGHQDEVEAEA